MRPVLGTALLVPLLALLVLGFAVPVLYMLTYSITGRDGLTLEHYRAIGQSAVYARVIASTFKISAIVTLAIVVVGYPLAYWMSGLRRSGQIIALALVVLPFWVSALVRTYAWIVLLGNAGVVNRLLLALGLTGQPVAFLYNEFGVVVGMTNVLLPFLVLPLYAAMIRLDRRLFQAAASLGAGEGMIFRRVFFPLTIPALAAGAALVFILSLGFFITPAILGGGKVPMIASTLDLLVNRLPRWEIATSLATLLLAATLALFAASRGLAGRSEA